MSKLYPKQEENKVYDIDFDRLYKMGMRGVIFDIDNTLSPHGMPADDKIIEFFNQLHNKGIRTFLLSNNKNDRVAPFAESVDSAYIAKAGKPAKKAYLEAMKYMKTDIKSTVFVGDQIFTDIYGANRLGIYSILLKPIHPREEIQIVLKRRLEAIVLYFYHRSKCRRGKS